VASLILDALVRPPVDGFYPHAPETCALPIAALGIEGGVRGLKCPARSEPVYGGYANGRGDIVLFAKDNAFRVNLSKQIVTQRPPLNFSAQARYDSTEPGEDFAYGNKVFRRLSHQQIADICAAGVFRIGSRF
jgi:hypothetical protein